MAPGEQERVVKSEYRFIMMDNATERVMRFKMSNVPEDIHPMTTMISVCAFFSLLYVSEVFSVCITLMSPRTAPQRSVSKEVTC